MENFSSQFLQDVLRVAQQINPTPIEEIAAELALLRQRQGRLFFIGIGGSAANCTHAVNDFRKLCQIEAYTPIDNVAELTARTNDEGWETVFSSWLNVSKACGQDALFIFSVGGGDRENNVSVNLIHAIDEAKKRQMRIYAVVGCDRGYTAKNGDIVIVVPVVNKAHVTPLAESFQAVVWHCLVSHPKLKLHSTKWESTTQPESYSIASKCEVTL